MQERNAQLLATVRELSEAHESETAGLRAELEAEAHAQLDKARGELEEIRSQRAQQEVLFHYML